MADGNLFRGLAAAAAILLAACTTPVEPAERNATIYSNFTLIDGTGAPARASAAMIVEDGRVAWVGDAAALQVRADAERVDLGGAYVTPGLIDLHVHLGVVNGRDLTNSGANYTRENVERELRTYAAYGVTTVQVMGTDQDLIYTIRNDERARAHPTMARFYTSGLGIVFRGGYGGVAGVNRPVATPEEARAEVNRQAAAGVDFIKFWVDDELGTMPAMPAEISQAVIEAAHANNLRAVAHIFYLADAERLVDQGVDGLVHGVRDQPITDALMQKMRARGTWQIAQTLSREASMFAYGERAPFLDDPFFTRSAAPSVIEALGSEARRRQISQNPHFSDYPRFLDNAERNLRALAAAGISYGFGTDSGPPGRFPGYFAHWELELMVEAGFSPLEAVASATGRAAQFLRDRNIGTLEVGKLADFVVYDADPLADIRNTRSIRAVYMAGHAMPATP